MVVSHFSGLGSQDEKETSVLKHADTREQAAVKRHASFQVLT